MVYKINSCIRKLASDFQCYYIFNKTYSWYSKILLTPKTIKLMKVRISIISFLLLFFVCSVFSQNPDYQVKKINNKEYLLYPVQPGEGLYGIARRFSTSVKELNDLNPEASTGLKTGQILLIPFNREKKQDTATSPVTTELQKKMDKAENYITYLVEKKQTLFAICKMYNVTPDELKRLNPDLETGLKTGMTLRIPQKTTDTGNRTEKSDIRQKGQLVTIKHTVQPHETLYALSKKYKVKVEDIVSQNPDTYNGIIIGTDLYIDIKKELADKLELSETKRPEKIKEETYNISSEEVKNFTQTTTRKATEQTSIRVAILLPLTPVSKTDLVTERFQDFYAGFLLAASDAKKRGISLEINTFETEKSEEKIQDILQNPKMKNADLIIGPAYSNQISYVTDFALANKINTVIPFSSKVPEISSNPYLFQFNPNAALEVEFFCELMQKKFSNENLIFVNIPGVNANDGGLLFSNELKNELQKKNIKFRQVENVTDLNSVSADIIAPDKKNVFVFNTDKFSSVSPYLNFLNQSSNSNQIVLYEQYSWKNQTAGYKFNSMSIAPFKPLTVDSVINNYNTAFRKSFKWKNSSESPRYDILGYDLGNYFITLINEFGPQFGAGKSKLPLVSGVQSYLKFERTDPRSGFVNTQLYQHTK